MIPLDLMHMWDVVPSLVSLDDNNFLSTIPSENEVQNIVFSIDLNSAINLNGFLSLFYQKSWDVIGLDIYVNVWFFIVSGYLELSLNSRFFNFDSRI